MIPAPDLSHLDDVEAEVEDAAIDMLTALADETLRRLRLADWNTDVLDSRWPVWRDAVTDFQDVLGQTYLDGFVEAVESVALTAAAKKPINPRQVAAQAKAAKAAAGLVDPTGTSYIPYAQQHVASTTNRLVGVADRVFDNIREVVHEQTGTGNLSDLAEKIEAELTGTQRQYRKKMRKQKRAVARISNRLAARAQTIARTETIAANNAGAFGAADYTGTIMGYTRDEGAKEWVATDDDRTRETHNAVDGEVVLGLDTTFAVGDSNMQHPGDFNGSASEVINCRCSMSYLWPGDENYPDTESDPPIGTEPSAFTMENFDDDTMVGFSEAAPWITDETDRVRALHKDYVGDDQSMATDAITYFKRDPGYQGKNLDPNGDRLRAITADPYREGLTARYGYIGADSDPMNAYLRYGTPSVNNHDRASRAMADLWGTDATATVPKDVIAWRGVKRYEGQDWGNLQPGDYLSDPAFMSTTLNKHTAEEYIYGEDDDGPGGWILKIRVPKGTEILPGTNFEQEMILPPGTVLRTVGVDKAHGTIWAEMVPA